MENDTWQKAIIFIIYSFPI